MKDTNYSKSIHWLVENEELYISERLHFEHSNHSFKRACQRNISEEEIKTSIEYGTAFFKQGLVFYAFGRKNRAMSKIARHGKNYADLVVVVSGASNTILTCYRSANPFKHIKKKQKNLSKQYASAA